ncbi:DUF397 domain-containing protein [Amycolatopsis sp. WAC 01376]|nr:DUF397 domain-containing protein [Amycolatopsis sp. WAC 01376]
MEPVVASRSINNDDCVEVFLCPENILARDTKTREHGHWNSPRPRGAQTSTISEASAA